MRQLHPELFFALAFLCFNGVNKILTKVDIQTATFLVRRFCILGYLKEKP